MLMLLKIIRRFKKKAIKKKAKKDCDKKCKYYVNIAQKALLVGDDDFAKECIHKQVETHMKYIFMYENE